jgi:alkyl hydroperoxide reductase subunit AhpC
MVVGLRSGSVIAKELEESINKTGIKPGIMSMEEEEVHKEWMNDESGEVDLCRFCVGDANHPLGSECARFRWNGKTVREVYPGRYK